MLIDDDTELCELMQEFFAARGIRLAAIHDGRRGLAEAFDRVYDLILLDVMLPGLDGFELLRQVRRRSHVPIIMLTARTANTDRVAGLDAGADDYLPKPFDPDELIARIRAVLRRSGRFTAPGLEILEVNGVRLSPSTREVWSDGREVDLTTIEFDILDLIIRSAGRVVSRDELTAAIHQRPASPLDRSLDVHVSHLRKKLGRRGIGDSHRPRGRLPVPCRAARAQRDRSDEVQDQVDLHQDRLVVRRHGRPLAGRSSWARRCSSPRDSRAATRTSPRLNTLFLDDARRAYEEGGSAQLAAYLKRLDAYSESQHFLTDGRGIDLVTGEDRSDLRRARQARGASRPPCLAHRAAAARSCASVRPTTAAIA